MPPVQECQDNNKPGFKWGEHGNKCYTYDPKNESSRRTAKKSAILQGLAIGDFSKVERITCKNCGWEWDMADGGNDPYICHKCGYDNQIDNMNFQGIKVSFDYHETLTTDKGKEYLKKEMDNKNIIYIISAAHDIKELLPFAKKYGIRLDRVFATGSNKRKVEKIKELKIVRHYDNAQQVKDIIDKEKIKVELIKV